MGSVQLGPVFSSTDLRRSACTVLQRKMFAHLPRTTTSPQIIYERFLALSEETRAIGVLLWALAFCDGEKNPLKGGGTGAHPAT